MDINFELYKIFYFTAENLSFTQASEILYVTQSSISQSIKQLENKLGCQLFSRNKKKIQLTREGQILFAHVEQAYKHFKVAERKLENHSIGEVHIGASDTICKYFLLPYLKDFHKENPNIKINIVNQPSRATLEMIQEGLMDFGIVAASKNDVFTDIRLSHLKDYEEVCIVGEDIHKVLQSPTTLDELLKYPMITLRSNTNTRKFLDEAFKERNLLLQPEFEMVSVDLIIEMVKAGLGIGFAMADTLKNIDQDPELFSVLLEPPLRTRQLAFVTSETLPLSEASKLFMDHIMAIL